MASGLRRTNGTEYEYVNASVIELQGVINHSYTFMNFTYDSSAVAVNPYNLTITSNLTIWLIVANCSAGSGNGGNGTTVTVYTGLVLGVMAGLGIAAIFSPFLIALFRHRDDEWAAPDDFV